MKDAWERVEKAGESQVEALQSAGDERQSGATAQEIANIIDKRLEAGLQRLENKVDDKLENIQKAVQTPAKLSYADVAKSLRDAGAQLTKPPPTEVRAPGRHQREIIVAAGAETEEQKRRNGKELVEELNKRCAGKVLAARRLGSGDILVTTKDRTARQELQKETEWIEACGEGASLRRRLYMVMVHGIRVSTIDATNKPEAIEAIYSQNTNWTDIEILAVAWSRKTIRDRKVVAPLYVGVAEPEQANHLIDAGMCWESQLHDCEPFVGDCQVTQCFRCYKYGHTGRNCKDPAKCGYCGDQGHSTNTCLVKDNLEAHRCAACAKPEARHRAWSPECPVRKNRVTAARRAYAQRPTRFEVPRQVASIIAAATPKTGEEAGKVKPILQAKMTAVHQGNASGMQVDSLQAPAILKRTTVTVDSEPESDSDSYTQVKRRRATSARAAAPRGRPRNIDKPEKGNQNITTLWTPSLAYQL